MCRTGGRRCRGASTSKAAATARKRRSRDRARNQTDTGTANTSPADTGTGDVTAETAPVQPEADKTPTPQRATGRQASAGKSASKPVKRRRRPRRPARPVREVEGNFLDPAQYDDHADDLDELTDLYGIGDVTHERRPEDNQEPRDRAEGRERLAALRAQYDQVQQWRAEAEENARVRAESLRLGAQADAAPTATTPNVTEPHLTVEPGQQVGVRFFGPVSSNVKVTDRVDNPGDNPGAGDVTGIRVVNDGPGHVGIRGDEVGGAVVVNGHVVGDVNDPNLPAGMRAAIEHAHQAAATARAAATAARAHARGTGDVREAAAKARDAAKAAQASAHSVRDAGGSLPPDVQGIQAAHGSGNQVWVNGRRIH